MPSKKTETRRAKRPQAMTCGLFCLDEIIK